MRCHLSEELCAQYDFVFEAAGQETLVRIARVPDSRLAHEVETRMVRDRRFLSLCVGAEENRGTEDSLERRDQAAVLRTALLHAEDVQHFGGAVECDGLLLLSHGECR